MVTVEPTWEGNQKREDGTESNAWRWEGELKRGDEMMGERLAMGHGIASGHTTRMTE